MLVNGKCFPHRQNPPWHQKYFTCYCTFNWEKPSYKLVTQPAVGKEAAQEEPNFDDIC